MSGKKKEKLQIPLLNVREIEEISRRLERRAPMIAEEIRRLREAQALDPKVLDLTITI